MRSFRWNGVPLVGVRLMARRTKLCKQILSVSRGTKYVWNNGNQHECVAWFSRIIRFICAPLNGQARACACSCRTFNFVVSAHTRNIYYYAKMDFNGDNIFPFQFSLFFRAHSRRFYSVNSRNFFFWLAISISLAARHVCFKRKKYLYNFFCSFHISISHSTCRQEMCLLILEWASRLHLNKISTESNWESHEAQQFMHIETLPFQSNGDRTVFKVG